MPGLVVKYEPREKIAVRILLPVDEMTVRFDTQRVTRDRGAAVRRRPQTYDLRRKRDQAIVVVDRLVMNGYPNSHMSQKIKTSRNPHGSEFRDVIVPGSNVFQATV